MSMARVPFPSNEEIQKVLEDKELRSLFAEAVKLPFRRASYGTIDVSYGDYSGSVGKIVYKEPEDRLGGYDKAWAYYLLNPWARAAINITASATFGKGVEFVGDNEQVTFANSIIEQLDLFQVGTECGIYGEDFLRIFQSADDYAAFALALIPPQSIASKETDDENVNKVKSFVQKWGDKKQKTISATEMIHVMINVVSNSKFGNSDLTVLYYYLDLYDSVVEEADKKRLFASSPVGKFMNVESRFRTALKARTIGKSKDVDSRTGQKRSMPPGTQLILPPGVDYDYVESGDKFNLEGQIERLGKTIAMGAEIPAHWLSMGYDTNRATAHEMSYPFIKRIQKRQTIFARKFQERFKKMYDMAQIKRAQKDTVGKDTEWLDNEFDLTVKFPPIFDHELSEIQDMLKSIAMSRSEGYISQKTATDLVCQYLGVDIEKEELRLENEADDIEAEATETKNKIDGVVKEIGLAVANEELDKEAANRLIAKLVV